MPLSSSHEGSANSEKITSHFRIYADMGNIYFQKIQISGPAMNFVLEPQNFSGKNWNSPINTGQASLFRAITYNAVQLSPSFDS